MGRKHTDVMHQQTCPPCEKWKGKPGEYPDVGATTEPPTQENECIRNGVDGKMNIESKFRPRNLSRVSPEFVIGQARQILSSSFCISKKSRLLSKQGLQLSQLTNDWEVEIVSMPITLAASDTRSEALPLGHRDTDRGVPAHASTEPGGKGLRGKKNGRTPLESRISSLWNRGRPRARYLPASAILASSSLSLPSRILFSPSRYSRSSSGAGSSQCLHLGP